MQSFNQIVTINKPIPRFYRLDVLPVTQPTVSSTEGKASVILNMSTLRQHNTWLAVARRWLAVSVSVSKSYNRDDVSDTVTRVNDCPSQGTF